MNLLLKFRILLLFSFFTSCIVAQTIIPFSQLPLATTCDTANDRIVYLSWNGSKFVNKIIKPGILFKNNPLFIPYRGANQNVDLNNQKIVNINLLGIGTTSLTGVGISKLIVGDRNINGVNSIAIIGRTTSNNSEIADLYFYNANSIAGFIRSQRMYNNNSASMIFVTSDSLGNLNNSIIISDKSAVGIKKNASSYYALDVRGTINSDSAIVTPSLTTNTLTLNGVSTHTTTGTGAMVLANSPTLTGTITVPAITTTAITTTSLTIGVALNPLVQTISTSTITPDGTKNKGTYASSSTAFSIVNPSAAFADGKDFSLVISDNGVARAITFGNLYIPMTAALPTTTTAGKAMQIYFMYDSALGKYLTYSSNQQ